MKIVSNIEERLFPSFFIKPGTLVKTIAGELAKVISKPIQNRFGGDVVNIQIENSKEFRIVDVDTLTIIR